MQRIAMQDLNDIFDYLLQSMEIRCKHVGTSCSGHVGKRVDLIRKSRIG